MFARLAIVIAVVALLGAAAALATPRGRLPLALRGVSRLLRQDRGQPAAVAAVTPVSRGRRLCALGLVLAAVALAIWGCP